MTSLKLPIYRKIKATWTNQKYLILTIIPRKETNNNQQTAEM
jgi:hypothetical protein